MLAQNFKTPADLGVTDEQFAALARVLAMLERGEIPHHSRQNDTDAHDLTVFDMSEWHCGSAGCLGGWAEQIGRLPRRSLSNLADDRPALFDLFYPDGPGRAWTRAVFNDAGNHAIPSRHRPPQLPDPRRAAMGRSPRVTVRIVNGISSQIHK